MNITRRQMMGGITALGMVAALPRWAEAAPASPFTWARKGFFVTTRTQCAVWCKKNPKDPRAQLIYQNIASKPVARWVFDDASISDAQQDVKEAFSRQQLPVIVAYNLPNRDLGSHSGGGAASTKAYADWAKRLAKAVGNCPALVIIEPDALMHATGLGADEQRTICTQLNAAIDAFARYAPKSWIYVDAGSGDWPPVNKVVPLLRQLTMKKVRGISVNVSNYNSDAVCRQFAKDLTASLRAENIIINGWVYDTSRNGTGVAKGGEWCNPSGKRIGKTARANTNGADACLWVKLPGESDGECGAYPKQRAGMFAPEIAYNLIKGV